ncbi:MAG: LysR family transcriptional regulator [Pseudomonadota bacterium]
MEDWNDLKLVLAVARAGSLTGAARALGIDHSTAYRRMTALERRLAVRLFDRLPGGRYAPTSAGERMAAAAERVESETAALDRDLLGADLRLSGRLRVTCSESLAYALLTPCVAGFRREHPGIAVDVAIDNRALSLAQREADVALRVSRPREPNLHGRKVANVAWTLYGTPELAIRADPTTAWPNDLPVVGWETGVVGVNAADWLAREVPEAAVVYRTNSVVNQLVAAREGIGLALLPCFLADREPGLLRVRERLAELSRELWIITHEDLRRAARVRAFMDWTFEYLAGARAALAGDGASADPPNEERSGHAPI